jgi:hypothetical protein
MDSTTTSNQPTADPEPLYRPLNTKNREIRLVEILDTPDGSVCCQLSTVAFTNPATKPQYSALSYVWGDASDTENITVNGKTVPVTKNLAVALRHVKEHWAFEFPDRDRSSFRIWVDALCINQQDLEERNQQVQAMRYLYPLADIVLAWICGEDEQVPLAFETIELLDDLFVNPEHSEQEIVTLAWLKRERSLCQDDNHDLPSLEISRNHRWESLRHLFDLPYWDRVWIFQEIVLAHRLICVCPSKRLDAQILNDVTYLMVKMRNIVQKDSLARPSFLSKACWSAITHPFINWVVIERIDVISDRLMGPSGYIGGPASSIAAIQLSEFGRCFRATDPKDHIYGLLGLTHMSIIPDYQQEKSVADVYCDYVACCLESFPENGNPETDELFFLIYAGRVSEEDLGLPSWAPNYPEATNGNWPVLNPAKTDAGVGIFEAEIRTRRAFVSNQTLFVIGLSVQEVKMVAQCPAPGPSTYQDMFAFFSDFISHRKTYLTGIPPLQALFRVLRRIDGPPRSYTTLMEVICFLKQLLVGLMVFKLEDIFAIISSWGGSRKPLLMTGFLGPSFLGSKLHQACKAIQCFLSSQSSKIRDTRSWSGTAS